MKSLTYDLSTHVTLETTTLSSCWKIERKDEVVLGFTDHDVDIPYDGVIYHAETGFTRSAIKSSSDSVLDQLDVQGLLNSELITPEDIRAGLYNGASIYFFLINWNDPTDGIIRLRRGLLGEVKVKENVFVAELQGMGQYLNREILGYFTPECPWDFGDTDCGYDSDSLKQTTEVTEVTNRKTFKLLTGVGGIDTTVASLPSYGFSFGRIKFTSGSNTNIILEIKSFDPATGSCELWLSAPFTPTVSDELEIWPGCDKRFDTCKEFSNYLNFGGCPDIPGIDSYLQYPDAKS